ncbi:MAG: DNA repair exonuclease [Euryarchaeota archaeon]|nr:DNA repair exonuclease [Euryarchaeota archaeon]
MIVHTADSHLGLSRYSRIDSEKGLNLRLLDFCYVFREVIDFVTENKPELFLISGDLFDNVNPTNFIRKFVQKELFRVSEAKVSTFIIPGNHETPRTRGVANPLALYTTIPHIFVGLKPFEKTIGAYRIHGVPYTEDPTKHIKNPKKGFKNILMLHTTIEGAKLSSERYMSFDESSILPSQVPKYEYVALGHIHKFQILKERFVYPGSLEKYDFSEFGDEKGFVVYDGEIEFIETKTREMNDFTLSCQEKTGFEITEEAMGKLEDIDDKIVRIILEGEISMSDKKDINYQRIKERANIALHFILKDTTTSKNIPDFKEEKLLFSPKKELKRYLKTADQSFAYETGTEIIDEVFGR